VKRRELVPVVVGLAGDGLEPAARDVEQVERLVAAGGEEEALVAILGLARVRRGVASLRPIRASGEPSDGFVFVRQRRRGTTLNSQQAAR